MHRARLLIFSFLISLFAFAPAHALTMESGEFVLINDRIDDDVYIAAGDGDIQGDINGDLFIVGGSVTISGNVKEDLFMMGGEAIVRGDVGGDLRVIAGDVMVSGKVGDDLVVASGRIDVAETTVVGGSIFGGSGYLKMSGDVREDINGGFGALLLNGKVSGNVVVSIQDDFRVDESSSVGGNLEYSAFNEIGISQGVVKGETKYTQFISTENVLLDKYNTVALVTRLLSYLGALVIALILVIWAPRLVTRVGIIAKEHPAKALGFGVLTVIVGLIAPIILAMTVIGIPLGIITWVLLALYVYLGKIFSAAWLSSYIVKGKKRGKVTLQPARWKLALGISFTLLVYYSLTLVPFIGMFVKLILFLIGIGAAVMIKIEYWNFLREKKKM